MKKVFIELPEYLTEVMFKEEGWKIVKSVREADLVCFIGGADVTPILYHEENTGSRCDSNHDLHSIRTYMDAKEYGVSCVGICRGGQFLNVMNGGKMHQHISGHGISGTHTVVLDVDGGNSMGNEWEKFHSLSFEATSVHHQGIILSEDADILVLGKSEDDNVEVVVYLGPDDYRDLPSYSLCFQPHPEYKGAEDCRKVFFDLIEEYIL